MGNTYWDRLLLILAITCLISLHVSARLSRVLRATSGGFGLDTAISDVKLSLTVGKAFTASAPARSKQSEERNFILAY